MINIFLNLFEKAGTYYFNWRNKAITNVSNQNIYEMDIFQKCVKH